MIALGYGVYLKWKTSRASASVSNVGALALRAERREGALRVSWNRDAVVINHAKDGILSIRDSDLQPQEPQLGLEQLRTGSVVYSPTNKSVLFQLEVTGRDETKTHETILALAGSDPPGASCSRGTTTRADWQLKNGRRRTNNHCWREGVERSKLAQRPSDGGVVTLKRGDSQSRQMGTELPLAGVC